MRKGEDDFTKKQFKYFKEAAEILENLDVTFVVFGGIAVWAYGRKRKTKDIDLLLDLSDAPIALNGLFNAGWTTRRTDEKWLYQATKDGVQVDLIFKVIGGFVLTKEIEKRAICLDIMGESFKVISPEDLILIKIHALKEIRPADWYDAISVIEGTDGRLDWNYLINKAKRDPRKILSFFLFADTEISSNFIPNDFLEKLMEYSLKAA